MFFFPHTFSGTVATIFRTLIFPNLFQPLPKPKPLSPSKSTLYPMPYALCPIPYTLYVSRRDWEKPGEIRVRKKVARSPFQSFIIKAWRQADSHLPCMRVHSRKRNPCNLAQILVCPCCSSWFCAGAHLRSKNKTLQPNLERLRFLLSDSF